MIPEQLSSIGNNLRRAAGQHAYAETEVLVVTLCSTAAATARALPEGDPQIAEIVAWVGELLEWTGIMLRTSRAAQADELRRVPFLQGYLRQQSLSNL